MSNRAEELIACLEAEIVKRDARIDHKDLAIVNLQSALASARNELAALKVQPSAGVVPPKWLRDDESMAERLKMAGWVSSHDAQWSGAELLRLEILREVARLNPCRAQAVAANHTEQNLDMVPDGWVCGNCGSNVQTRLDDGARQKESGDE